MARLDGITAAVIFALLFAMASARPCLAQSKLASRDYVEMEAIEDPAFQSFWNEFQAAVAQNSGEVVADMTSFPLPRGRSCLEREEFIAQYGSVLFSEAARAIVTSPRLVTSRSFPGEYYGVIAQYRDANEGNEEFYEFSKVKGVFKLSRVGSLDMICEPRVEPTLSVLPAVPRVEEPASAEPPATQGSPSQPNRFPISAALLLLYAWGSSRLSRWLIDRHPHLRIVPVLFGCLLIAVGAWIGWYLPAHQQRHLWSGVMDQALYLAGALVALLGLPPLVAGLRHGRGRNGRFMQAVTILFFLIVGFGSAFLAYGFWEGWQAAARNSASPGAIVLPFIAITFGLFSIGGFVRAANTWRRRKRESDAP